MTTLAIFRAVELEIGEFPQLLLPEPFHPSRAGFGITGQNLSSLLQHNLLYGQFLLKVSQGRKEPLWSGCVMRLKEQFAVPV